MSQPLFLSVHSRPLLSPLSTVSGCTSENEKRVLQWSFHSSNLSSFTKYAQSFPFFLFHFLFILLEPPRKYHRKYCYSWKFRLKSVLGASKAITPQARIGFRKRMLARPGLNFKASVSGLPNLEDGIPHTHIKIGSFEILSL